MGLLTRFSLDVVIAVIAALWFMGVGIGKLPSPPTGRRTAAAEPGWLLVLRRVRGLAELLGGLAVLAGAALALLRPQLAFPGLALGLTLAGLAAWETAEAVYQRRWLRLTMALIGFGLAVFYAGFRG